jgi:hypothetical protein
LKLKSVLFKSTQNVEGVQISTEKARVGKDRAKTQEENTHIWFKKRSGAFLGVSQRHFFSLITGRYLGTLDAEYEPIFSCY